MKRFSENMFIFALKFCAETVHVLLKKETLVVYWVSETANIQRPEDRQPVFVLTGTDYCCCRGRALGGA